MNQEHEARFHQLISEAVQYDVEERHAFLAAACGDDPDLFEDVWQAVRISDTELGDFLESPALAPTTRGAASSPAAATVATRMDRGSSRPLPSFPRPTDTPTVPLTSVLSRLRATRGVSVFLLLALAGPLLVTAAGRGTAALLAGPDMGLKVGSLSGKVVQVSERWTGVRNGDELLTVDGLAVGSDPVRVRAAFLSLREGPVTLGFGRGDQRWTVTAEVAPWSSGLRWVTWARVLTGSLLFLIGAASFVLRPGHRVTWLFFFFCSSLTLHLLAYTSLIHRPPEGLILESIGLYLTAASGLHLFTLFPSSLLRRKVWALAFYLPAGLAAAILAGLYRSESALPLVATVQRLGAVVASAAALGAALLVLAQYRKAVRRDDDSARSRSRALFVAVLLGLAFPAILGAVRMVRVDVDWAVNSLPVVLFVTIAGYSMVRHNAMEVDRFTAAILGYALTSLILLAAFFGLVVGLPVVLGQREALASPVAVAALTASCFAAVHPIYRRVRRKVDRWFHRETVEDDTALRLLRQLADSVRTADLTSTFRVGLDTAMVLDGEQAEIWTRTADGASLVRICSDRTDSRPTPLSLDADGALARALEESSGGVAGLADQALPPEAQLELWARDLVLAAPLFAGDRMQGFVGLARKKNGSRYTRHERTFLDAVASQMGIALERSWELSERVGPYRVLERLGTGGMAEVFLAEKHGPGGFERRVAMKRMLPHLAQNANCVAMFLDEARIAAQLHHPNIVQIYDIEKYEETYYLAMELMDGPTLSKVLRHARKQGTHLPPPVAAAVGMAVLSALGYAHRGTDRRGKPLGLVHRDVKPGNILLSRQGEIKLSDFGIAHAEFRLYQTQPGMTRGTPPYMAPEQGHGVVGPRADLFAAGAVIYEMLTGRQAFPQGPHPDGSLPCLVIPPDLPPSLAGFLTRALAESPEDRFPSAEDMREVFIAAMAPVRPADAETVAESVAALVPASPRRPPSRPAQGSSP